MPIDLDDLRDRNQTALDALDRVRIGLKKLANQGDARATARLGEVSLEIAAREFKAESLRNASAVLDELSPELAEKLQLLSNKLDQQIRNNELISAGIDVLTQALSDARQLGSVVDSLHVGAAPQAVGT